ncbi:uncharacterized protein LOC136083369 [Hydra vulgaris]|uniref:Uncharacterized protein LOC136083369 n=1 Tax=Hydra vulgaris TaxID=6087 RepID=A0ABM4CB03_HYDVU
MHMVFMVRFLHGFLGPLLFVLYINDLPDLTHNIKLYGDDSFFTSDVDFLQADINKAVEWSRIWLMKFNIKKCKVMHIGQGSTKSNQKYYMYDDNGKQVTLADTYIERDLGVLISDNLKVKMQVDSAAMKANQMLGIFKKSISVQRFKSEEIALYNLY